MAVIEKKRVRESSWCLEPSSACVWNGHECLEREKGELTKVARLGLSQGSVLCLKSCTVYGVLRFCHSVLLRSALGTQQTYRLCCVPLARTLSPCLLPSQTARRPARPSSGRPHLPPPSMERPRGGRDEAAVDQLRRARADPTRGQCRADTSRDSRWCW
eukprot:CAMPEP_0196682156 /NCGR_PEP_ID=MMETSP1090-20130531/9032_1 /TAXON_ID=37098 /ORGANISM="Isochrysis sp, Strain CCMP1244" /LENGTH=158 /DNA_ID=CAMNT_0042020559 /DNA_START=16 /DNA_END=492 /DNA_ORIENTATION=-